VEDQEFDSQAGETTEQEEAEEEEAEAEEGQEDTEAQEFNITDIWRMDNIEHFPNEICREYANAFVNNNYAKVGKLLSEDVTLSSPVGECAGSGKVLDALRTTRGRMAEEVSPGAPKASGPASSKVQFEFVSGGGKVVQLVDDVVVQRRVITQIVRKRLA
jgi:hypothetical protein